MQALDKAECEELEFFSSMLIFPTTPAHLENMRKKIKVNSKNSADVAWFLVIFFLPSNGGLNYLFT